MNIITVKHNSTTECGDCGYSDPCPWHDAEATPTLSPERLAWGQNMHHLAGWFAGHRFGENVSVLHDHTDTESEGYERVAGRIVWAVMRPGEGIVGSVEWDRLTLSNGGWSSCDDDSQLDPF